MESIARLVCTLLLLQCLIANLPSRYGGGPAIPRKVIEEGRNKTARVEVYPLSLKVTNTNEEGRVNSSSQIEVLISKQATVAQLKKLLHEKMELKISSSNTRLWCNFDNKSVLLKSDDKSLEDSKVLDKQTLILEVKLKDGSWPKERKLKPPGGQSKKKKSPMASPSKDALFGALRSVESFITGKPKKGQGWGKSFFK